MEGKIMTLHPDGKAGVNINKDKYEIQLRNRRLTPEYLGDKNGSTE